MMLQQVIFPSGAVDHFFSSSIAELPQVCHLEDAILITDEHVLALHPDMFAGRKTLTIAPGEASKDISTVERLAAGLIGLGATRKTMLVGVGGGVVTDITGFLASVFMRGVRCGFVPTTLLAMTDAALGGKNGVNTGLYKNMLGTIRQPEFILYDTHFLTTLPTEEWSNGFAEIIKYGAIFDAGLLTELAGNNLGFYRQDATALNALITRCARWKNKTVVADEHEQGQRKLLNFGHTAGHAIEQLYGLPHGQAVAIGMVIACSLSEEMTGLSPAGTQLLKDTLQRYNLPVWKAIDSAAVMGILAADKKRTGNTIDYILLEAPGRAVIKPLPMTAIADTLKTYESTNRTRQH